MTGIEIAEKKIAQCKAEKINYLKSIGLINNIDQFEMELEI